MRSEQKRTGAYLRMRKIKQLLLVVKVEQVKLKMQSYA
jgi:hypothetical protein